MGPGDSHIGLVGRVTPVTAVVASRNASPFIGSSVTLVTHTVAGDTGVFGNGNNASREGREGGLRIMSGARIGGAGIGHLSRNDAVKSSFNHGWTQINRMKKTFAESQTDHQLVGLPWAAKQQTSSQKIRVYPCSSVVELNRSGLASSDMLGRLITRRVAAAVTGVTRPAT